MSAEFEFLREQQVKYEADARRSNFRATLASFLTAEGVFETVYGWTKYDPTKFFLGLGEAVVGVLWATSLRSDKREEAAKAQNFHASMVNNYLPELMALESPQPQQAIESPIEQ